MNSAAPRGAEEIPGSSRPFIPWHLLFHWIWRYLGIWAFLGVIIFIVQTILSYMLHDMKNLENVLKLLDAGPKFFKAIIGGDELMVGNASGIVAIGYQHPLVLLMLLINAVTIPSGLLTGEAEHGTMELLLSRPVTRGKVYFLTALVTMLGQILLCHVVFLGTAVWTNVFDYGVSVPLAPFYMVTLNFVAKSAAVAGIAMMFAAICSERGRAIAIVVTYLVVSYLLNFGAVYLPSLKKFHPYTLFYYYQPNAVIRAGKLPWEHISVLMAISVVCTAIGYFVWRRRDIAAA